MNKSVAAATVDCGKRAIWDNHNDFLFLQR